MSESISVIDPLQDKRWDPFVEQHAFGWLCHLSGWKRVLDASFKHMRGHYLVLIQDGMIQAALPLYEVRSRLTGNRLVSIPFATLSDPLVSGSDDMTRLFNAALELSKRLKIDILEIRTLSSSASVQDNRLGMANFYKHHYIMLDGPLEGISKKFHRSCVRQRITRALNSNIELTEGDAESDPREFYKLYLVSRKRLCLPPQPYRFIYALWETFHPEKKVSLLMARKDGALIGSLMLFKFKDRVSAEFAVYDESYLNISPLHRMFWEAMQTAHREGYKIFDFGRTSPNNLTLMDFKNRWGAAVVDLPNYYYPRELCNRDANQDNSLSRKVIREVCKAAPMPLYTGLGNFLYKHMS